MKIKKFESRETMRTMFVKQIAHDAEENFWSTVADKFPEDMSGDFPPDATIEFNAACEKAIKIWLETNESRRY